MPYLLLRHPRMTGHKSQHKHTAFFVSVLQNIATGVVIRFWNAYDDRNDITRTA